MMRTPTRPPWDNYTSYAWGGYIWNRSPTNETWRFAVGVVGYSRLWIGNDAMYTTDNNIAVSFINKELTPGPHPFLFKVNSRKYSHPGSIDPRNSTNKEWKKDGFGLAVSRTSAVSTNSDDFVFMENTPNTGDRDHPGGNGILFTLDNRDTTHFDENVLTRTAASRRTYSNIVCSAGTTIDLGDGNEIPLITPCFEGVTTVTNGGLIIDRFWKLSPENFAGDADMLKAYGKIEFGENATLDWENLSLLPRKEYVIATATGGISGIPAWNPSNRNHAMWRLRKEQDAEGNDTLIFKWHSGTAVIIR
jgi:hypothetical protein